jgi:hypothetical protein
VAGVVEIHGEVAGLLGQPGAGGVGGDAEDVHPAGGVLDDEERGEPVQGDGVQLDKSQARIACACARRNCLQVGPARRGEGSIPAWFRMFQTVEALI